MFGDYSLNIIKDIWLFSYQVVDNRSQIVKTVKIVHIKFCIIQYIAVCKETTLCIISFKNSHSQFFSDIENLYTKFFFYQLKYPVHGNPSRFCLNLEKSSIIIAVCYLFVNVRYYTSAVDVIPFRV
ncbi:MAG: hypothetical protein BWY31_02043 [Lentisphaerae bacterium ADurb.Bin242]|nr:MAG: hypothetical protein BWY31_02043 [Lentisphaerae bacterium ADurb.Bin242]